ncbi:hypothetical protein [Micromonospora tulbaghiae]|uniref:hypothetical protein n=1 Tax=Micromonospora tulbaghiae TaxID=479978 RepID=UPI003408AE08
MPVEPLWRVTYALPGHNRVFGVVRAATATAAVEKVEREEKTLGRGPLIDRATDVEQVHETEPQ